MAWQGEATIWVSDKIRGLLVRYQAIPVEEPDKGRVAVVAEVEAVEETHVRDEVAPALADEGRTRE